MVALGYAGCWCVITSHSVWRHQNCKPGFSYSCMLPTLYHKKAFGEQWLIKVSQCEGFEVLSFLWDKYIRLASLESKKIKIHFGVLVLKLWPHRLRRVPSSRSGRSGNPKIAGSTLEPAVLKPGQVKRMTLKCILVTASYPGTQHY